MPAYQVLARKWRPHSFEQLVGQEAVVRALSNALAQQRLHHAYLFTGTRGVGKTTIARIMAKCFNCEQGVTNTPCNTCQTCVAIDQGRFMDLIEVDAASRTKVEDTRELLDNVQYAPTDGRYKVYLIDEVHMLSGHSFNALLKTLEEPPPHVKFLLATTDPQKLPVTVLSRCLQFHLKNMPAIKIQEHLAHVLHEEKLPFDDEALALLAQAANGSMRDALSLLDQAIAYGNQSVTTADVTTLLGHVAQFDLFALLKALHEQNAEELLIQAKKLSEHVTDATVIIDAIIGLFHQLAIAQFIPGDNELQKYSGLFQADQIQLYYQIALMARRDLPLVPNKEMGFEMMLLRMLAFHPNQTNTTTTPPTTTTPQKTAASTTRAAPQSTAPKMTSQLNTSSDWKEIISQLPLTGATQALIQHCALERLTEQEIVLKIDDKHAILLNDKHQQRIASAVEQAFQKPLKLTIIRSSNQPVASPIQQTEQAIHNDPKIQSLQKTFQATIVPGSIKSLE